MPANHSLHPIKLENGIEGCVISVPGSSVVSYKIAFAAGYHHANSVSIPPQASHVLEHILMGWVTDPQYPTRTAFVKELRRNGAYSNGHTNASHNWYDGSTITEEWERVLDMQRTALSIPRLDKNALQAESGNAKEEMRRNVGDNSRLVYELALSSISSDMTTSKEAIGSIDSITLEDIKKVYEQAYTRHNLKFLLAGDFENKIDDVRKHFGAWSNLAEGEKAYSNNGKLAVKSQFRYVRRESLETIYMQLSIGLTRQFSRKERYALRILNNYLFSDTTSKVTSQAREKGWCYGISTYIEIGYGDAGVLSITAPISPDNVQSLFRLIVDEVRQCVEAGISKEDLAAVKSYAKGRFIRYGQTMEELLDFYDDYFTGSPLMGVGEQLTALQSVTSQDITAILKELLGSGIWTLAGVGGVEEDTYRKAYTVMEGLFK